VLPATVDHNNRLNTFAEEGRERAKKALTQPERSVKSMSAFRTPLGILADAAHDGIDLEEFLFAVEPSRRRRSVPAVKCRTN
jgi:hypothetical protein